VRWSVHRGICVEREVNVRDRDVKEEGLEESTRTAARRRCNLGGKVSVSSSVWKRGAYMVYKGRLRTSSSFKTRNE